MVANFLILDYQTYKDLSYCIKTITKGELFNIDLKEEKIINATNKLGNIKNRRFTIGVAQNLDGFHWLQTFNN